MLRPATSWKFSDILSIIITTNYTTLTRKIKARHSHRYPASKSYFTKPSSTAALIANSNPTNEKIKNYNSQNALSKIIHTHKADSLYVRNSNFLSDVENISQKQTSGLEKVSNEIIAGVQPI